MKRFAYLAFLLFVGLYIYGVHASAVTIPITSNTTWSSINNGTGAGGQPSSSDDIIVSKGRTLTVDVTNGVCRTLQLGTDSGGNGVAGNGTLSFSSSTSKVTVSGVVTLGDVNNSGSISMSNGGTLSAQGFSVNNLTSWAPGTGTVQLTATNTLPASSSFNTFNNLTINGSGTTTTLGQSTTVSGTLTLTAGTLAISANTLTLSGPAIAGTATNLSTTSLSSLVFSGSSSGVSIPSSVTTLNRLQINNSNGVSMNGNLTLNGTLTFTSGNLTTGSYVLTSAPSCISSISRTSGYVVGNLKLTYPSSGGTCTYHIGSSAAYTPISLTVSTSAGGTLTAYTTSNEHAQIDNNSGIDSTKDANRYWTLGATGDTLPANVTSYSATFNFITADLDSAATATNFIASYYASSNWTLPSSVTANSTSTVVSSVAGPITIPTDFAIGEASTPACTVPSDLPSGTSCVCDYFGRSSLNPSTINGGNWTVSSSSGTFGSPRIVNSGYLRLTDNSTNVSTVATLPGTFPAAGNLIALEFKHYAYKGTTTNTAGADGIALVLSDASVTPVAGAYGGSLGYAQKTGINGFAGGWIGVGLDEYGNYSNSLEGRSGGSGTSLVPDAIAVRGSGSGASATSNYPYLTTTGTQSTSIDSPTSTSRPTAQAYRVVVDARCYQLNTSSINCNNPTLAKKAQVTVYRDTTGTGTFSSSNKVIDFDAYTANSNQANVPTNWILSFTGSTGSLVNIHEVQGMRVCAQSISLPPDISVDNTTPSTCSTITTGKPTVTITARKSDGTTDTSYTKTVTLSAKLSSGSTSNAVFTLLSGSGTFSNNQYTFSASDQGVAKFTMTDTSSQDVYITVTESSSGLSSTSSVVQYRGTSFTVATNDILSSDGNIVAGRPHRMTVTRNTGCSTDTTYTGTKNLDGWYTPDDYHPAGAAAPQLCTTGGGSGSSSTCIPSVGSCTTLSIAAPSVNSTVNNLTALSFSNGVAYFCLSTSDVGKYTLSIRDDVTSTTSPIVGTSQNLTVIPYTVAISDIKQGTTANPGATTASGAKFTAAGNSFQATAAGYLWNSNSVTGDTNYDGVPDSSSPSFSSVSGGGVAAHYADTINLAASATYPSGGNFSGTINVTGGSSTVTNLTYNNVGSFLMTASHSANYLNSINLASRTYVYANSTSKPSQEVGRFYPDHFVVSNASITPACVQTSPATSFTYMGQQFNVSFKLTAMALGGSDPTNDALTNYDSSKTGSDGKNGYAKLSFSDQSLLGWGAIDVGGSISLTSRLDTSASPKDATTGAGATWSGGIANLTVPLTFSRNTVSGAIVPDAFSSGINLGIAPTDSDGVTVASSSLNLDTKDGSGGANKVQIGSATPIRFGRLKLSNAIGSDRLNLPIPATLEYYNGTAWITNTDDSCTSISNQSNMGFGKAPGNYYGSLNLINMPANTKLPSSISFSKGIGKLLLAPPTSANGSALGRGSVAVCVQLDSTSSGSQLCTAATASAIKPWLQSKWTSGNGYNDDPFARATFGVFGSGPIIYIRESY